MMTMPRMVLVLLLAVSAARSAQAAVFDHEPWNDLLQRHVVVLRAGQATQLDYTGMAHDHAQLKKYLAATSAVSPAQFDRWSASDQLAFLINAYNAWTVDLVLQGYPKIASIRDLGSLLQSPWKKRFVPLLGSTRSLDDIEHSLIGGSGRYREPRAHFALNCASIGCPALRPEAYVGAQLDTQLESATRRFLSDRSRNRYDGDTLEVSSIFRWYREDFMAGWRGARSLGAFLALYGDVLGLDLLQRQRLAQSEIEIGFLEYDWRLNRTP
jgi:hypothetical protein